MRFLSPFIIRELTRKLTGRILKYTEEKIIINTKIAERMLNNCTSAGAKFRIVAFPTSPDMAPGTQKIGDKMLVEWKQKFGINGYGMYDDLMKNNAPPSGKHYRRLENEVVAESLARWIGSVQ